MIGLVNIILLWTDIGQELGPDLTLENRVSSSWRLSKEILLYEDYVVFFLMILDIWDDMISSSSRRSGIIFESLGVHWCLEMSDLVVCLGFEEDKKKKK